MKIKIDTNVSGPGMTGFGPKFLIKHNNKKVSMHPPLPEHIEHVEHAMKKNESTASHHIVERRHPENDIGAVEKTYVGECCFSNKSKKNCPRCSQT